MKHKTAELEGALLDEAVALCEGYDITSPHMGVSASGKFLRVIADGEIMDFDPSSRWDQGGPIIDKNWRLITEKLFDWFGTKWRDSIDGKPGDTLRWFMRAYVASRFGDEVELP